MTKAKGISQKGAKRQRLGSLASLKSVNDCQLASVLKEVAKIIDDPDIEVDRQKIGRERRKDADQYLTSIQLPLEKGGEYTWHLCRIDLLINYFVKNSLWFKSALQETVRRCGHFLELVCYTDECTPGDAFAPDHTRKSQCTYVSIFEFGPDLLNRPESWLPLGVLRSKVVKEVDGGLPCVFRKLFRSWWCEEPLLLAAEGMVVELDEPTLVMFRETGNIQDLDAHRAVLSWKGVQSLKPCFKCLNCMKKGHPSVTEDSWQIDITETDAERICIATDDEMWEVIDTIAEAHDVGPAERFRELQMAYGLNHNPHGVWQDKELRAFVKPISGSRVDPMHTMYVGGVFGHQLWEYLHACRKSSKKYRFAHVREFLAADWQCPYQHRQGLDRIRNSFSEKREQASERKHGVKMSASEQVDLYPLIRRFAEVTECDELRDHCKVLYCICDLADALQQAKRRHYKCKREMARLIKDLVRQYLQVRRAVYGTQGVKPKHHMLLHIADQLLKDGILLDCWLLEHMHAMLKSVAEDLRVTTKFEQSVITRAVSVRRQQLQETITETRLLGPQEPSAVLTANLQHDAVVGRHLVMASGQQLHVDDIIFIGSDFSRCFVVKACYMSAMPGLVLEELMFSKAVTPACSRWQRAMPTQVRTFSLEGPEFVQHANYWTIDGVDIDVLHPVWWE